MIDLDAVRKRLADALRMHQLGLSLQRVSDAVENANAMRPAASTVGQLMVGVPPYFTDMTDLIAEVERLQTSVGARNRIIHENTRIIANLKGAIHDRYASSSLERACKVCHSTDAMPKSGLCFRCGAKQLDEWMASMSGKRDIPAYPTCCIDAWLQKGNVLRPGAAIPWCGSCAPPK